MVDDPDNERDETRRRLEAARGVFFVPSYQGHWVGVMLFAATLVGVTMLGSCWPAAKAVMGGGATGAADSGTAATFLTLYAAMAVGPIAGWALWIYRRQWAAVAVTALFAACVVWLSPAATL